MCWSASISFLTLALGSIGNAGAYFFIRRSDPRGAVILSYWQFALQMQLAEGLWWMSDDRGHNSIFAARAAMFYNILQPVVLAIVVWGTGSTALRAFQAISMYVVLIAVEFSEIWEASRTMAPAPECHHLDLGWFRSSRAAIYVTASVFCFLEIEDIFWRIVHLVFFLFTLFVSILLYPCGGGSMWCWMIAASGPITALAHTVRQRTRQAF